LRQVLVEWGVETRLGPVVFDLENIDDIWAVCARCAWLKTGLFGWEGSPLSVLAGDRVQLFFSLRYTAGIVLKKLNEVGLRPLSQFLTPCQQEGVWTADCSGEE
jgi:hypothetical protein